MKFLLDALKFGFKVLMSDIDIVYLKNPMPYFNCNDCDIESQADVIKSNNKGTRNCGFFFIRPTAVSKKFVELRIKMRKNNFRRGFQDQALYNKAIRKLGRQIKVRDLDQDIFQGGVTYFGRKFQFGNLKPCSSCVIVHNNCIRTKEAKIYRFKETGLWLLDEGQYYSSLQNKYLIYDNPDLVNSNEYMIEELVAFKNALAIGRILDRIVILPKFHNKFGKHVSVMDIVNIRALEKEFGGRYREHAFFKHPKIPHLIQKAYKENFKVILIESDKFNFTYVNGLTKLQVSDPANGANSEELLHIFANFSSIPILTFHNLYRSFSHFTNYKEQESFKKQFKRLTKMRRPATVTKLSQIKANNWSCFKILYKLPRDEVSFEIWH